MPSRITPTVTAVEAKKVREMIHERPFDNKLNNLHKTTGKEEQEGD